LTVDSDSSTRAGSETTELDEQDIQVRQSMAGGADAVFARSNVAPAQLSDFQIRKMIGKGTFGKVFLVEN